jgi:hypothetical protein
VPAAAASFVRFAMLRQVFLRRSLLEVDKEEQARASGFVMCQGHKAVCSDHHDQMQALSSRHEKPLWTHVN